MYEDSNLATRIPSPGLFHRLAANCYEFSGSDRPSPKEGAAGSVVALTDRNMEASAAFLFVGARSSGWKDETYSQRPDPFARDNLPHLPVGVAAAGPPGVSLRAEPQGRGSRATSRPAYLPARSRRPADKCRGCGRPVLTIPTALVESTRAVAGSARREVG
jgi:hypothetical protein